MFNFFKKDKGCQLYAPVCGTCISITEVPDPMFAGKMLGDGVAFLYEGDTICAPCDGEIVVVAETKHAVGIKTNNGAEILIHVGVDTVNLAGKGFEALVEVGQKVKRKERLIQLDRAILNEVGVNLVTPMVVTNGFDYEININVQSTVNLDTSVIEVKKK